MYTNERTMDNKQEELEAMVQQETYDVVAIMESSKGKGDANRLSRNKSKGDKPESGVKSEAQLKCMYTNERTMDNKQEELEAMVQQETYDVVAIMEREALDAMGIETNEDEVECLWVRIKGKANKADILVGVCYRPPYQNEEVDYLFYKQLVDVSGSPVLVLVGDFNLPDICCKLNTAEAV
ncbi:hypothetical protein HGM15179_018278 [Zosterops borbonicus]|uniref:Endonuclease/exonuclease/phosphatase domain-containing protein n=1 Tax=Zosterops borbonicus TaxID=364589 RepID=A0A8K1LCD4_9PASS|nr:hypothetical protein HGM15179_018278 [Zosterops borbonicus]